MSSGTILPITKELSYNSYMPPEPLQFKFSGDLYGKKSVIMEPFLGMLFGLMATTEFLNTSVPLI